MNFRHRRCDSVSFPLVLVFCFCLTNGHKLSSLKHLFVSSQSCGSQVQAQSCWLLCSKFQKGPRVEGATWTEFLSGGSGGRICLQAHAGCWWNAVHCGCRTEVPISSLAVSQWPFWASRGCPYFLPGGLLSLMPAVVHQNFLRLGNSDFLSAKCSYKLPNINPL